MADGSTKRVDTGGPAFPESGSRGIAASGEGMDLRDWFAGQALAGLCARPLSEDDGLDINDPAIVAEYAIGCANAMLAERGGAA